MSHQSKHYQNTCSVLVYAHFEQERIKEKSRTKKKNDYNNTYYKTSHLNKLVHHVLFYQFNDKTLNKCSQVHSYS